MKRIIYISLAIFMYSLYYTEAIQMFRVDTGVTFSIVYPIVMILSSLAILVPQRQVAYTELKPLIVLVLSTYCIALFHSIFVPFSARYYYFTLILPIFAGMAMYNLVIRGINENHLLFSVFAVYAMLSLFFFTNYRNNILLEFDEQNNAAYTILYFLPILLCARNKYIRYAVIAITAIALVFSLKRGGTLAFALALFAYFFVEFFVLSKNKNFFKYLILVSIGVVLLFQIFRTFFAEQSLMLFDRFSNDDEGSGRMGNYDMVLSLISNSSIFDFIFGHGINGVSINNPYRLSAHNDYLEFLYDYGVIGLGLLVSFIYKLFRHTADLLKRRSFYAGPAIVACVLIFVNSMISHVFFYEWYLLIFAIFWGYIYAIDKKTIIN